jgi:hypothetical protein
VSVFDFETMSATNPKCWVFVGPTLNGSTRLLDAAGVKLLPPVKRGDIDRLVSSRRPGALAIVDGQFHQCLSVGHAEIRSAIAQDWQVWGLSSMGAIRACEMRHMGVRGYGEVFDWFCRDEDFRDDEVSLTHLPTPPYLPLSEPLIHIRLWLRELVERRLLTVGQEKRVLDGLMALWFGDRTLSHARAMVGKSIPRHANTIDETLKNFDRFRIKSHDLSNFLRERPWSLHPRKSSVTKSIRHGASAQSLVGRI